MSAPSYPTRADANRANSQHSTGPRTEAGKATVSINAVRHGFAANLQRLDPRDSPAYQQHLADLTTGLAPANPAEEFLIRDLAMLKSRLERLEAEASAYLAAAPNLATLEKTERFLRRNYMQTWSRLERMQRERKADERMQHERQQATKVEQHQNTEAAHGITSTKQSQPGSTHSEQMPPTSRPAPTNLQANSPIDKAIANAA